MDETQIFAAAVGENFDLKRKLATLTDIEKLWYNRVLELGLKTFYNHQITDLYLNEIKPTKLKYILNKISIKGLMSKEASHSYTKYTLI